MKFYFILFLINIFSNIFGQPSNIDSNFFNSIYRNPNTENYRSQFNGLLKIKIKNCKKFLITSRLGFEIFCKKKSRLNNKLIYDSIYDILINNKELKTEDTFYFLPELGGIIRNTRSPFFDEKELLIYKKMGLKNFIVKHFENWPFLKINPNVLVYSYLYDFRIYCDGLNARSKLVHNFSKIDYVKKFNMEWDEKKKYWIDAKTKKKL